MTLFVHNHHHRSTTQVDKSVQVEERRAPTDQSVALLREMEEKAREQVLALVPINNNVLSGVVVHRWRDWAKSGSEIAVRFNLNGRDYTVQATFDDADFDWEGAVRDLVKALSGKIAESILGQVLEQVGPAPRRQ